MKYAIVEIECTKSIFGDRVYAHTEVMCTVTSREQAEDEKKLFEARDRHHYVVCEVQDGSN